jgi:methylated-DNA-[protein]-cysteine S-methyltransferase
VPPVVTRYTLLGSPIGELLLFGDGDALQGVFFDGTYAELLAQPEWQRDDAPFREPVAQLRSYFAGELTQFVLPLAARGTAFQQRVWAALLTIPYGTTTTYGTLAAELGDPRATRAVGLANGRNPIPIIIPCHRVIGADGRLTGYGGGLPVKQWLLAHEGRALPLDATLRSAQGSSATSAAFTTWPASIPAYP